MTDWKASAALWRNVTEHMSIGKKAGKELDFASASA